MRFIILKCFFKEIFRVEYRKDRGKGVRRIFNALMAKTQERTQHYKKYIIIKE